MEMVLLLWFRSCSGSPDFRTVASWYHPHICPLVYVCRVQFVVWLESHSLIHVHGSGAWSKRCVLRPRPGPFSIAIFTSRHQGNSASSDKSNRNLTSIYMNFDIFMNSSLKRHQNSLINCYYEEFVPEITIVEPSIFIFLFAFSDNLCHDPYSMPDLHLVGVGFAQFSVILSSERSRTHFLESDITCLCPLCSNSNVASLLIQRHGYAHKKEGSN